MNRITHEGDFCSDIALCDPGSCHCGTEGCIRKRMWYTLKAYEDTGVSPDEIRQITENQNIKA